MQTNPDNLQSTDSLSLSSEKNLIVLIFEDKSSVPKGLLLELSTWRFWKILLLLYIFHRLDSYFENMSGKVLTPDPSIRFSWHVSKLNYIASIQLYNSQRSSRGGFVFFPSMKWLQNLSTSFHNLMKDSL